MKTNGQCDGSEHVDAYLNGGKLDYCVEADEEGGIAWVAFMGAEGQMFSEKFAPPGSYTDGVAMLVPLRGAVEIRITPPEGETLERVRARLEASYETVIEIA